MSSPYPHLPETTASLIDLPLVDRIRYVLADRYIYHEQAADLIHRVKHLVDRPPGVRPTGIVLLSPSNGGKTALAMALLRRYGAREASKEYPASRPVVMFTMSGALDAGEIFARFLVALGVPHVSNMTQKNRRQKALQIAKAAGLRLIIIDEIQDVLLSTMFQQKMALLATKDLMNSLNVPVLAMGTEDASHSLEADKHLKERFKFHELPIWGVDEYLRHFLEAYESTLPLKKRSGLGSVRTMKVLVRETGGLLGAIVERLKCAAALAIESETEKITIDLIERARFEVPITDLSKTDNGREDGEEAA